ncbi:hypothetical protein CRE_13011 [Caenorhabditis remanei]|uniref:Uncharacterized protein n=1 Tax=Caenorhabditis remanei TaxID=31234 RepID=E3N180_CAERE|nr:hypothetical protein CRE_13011 [Caenorhabditis remanei]
MPPDQQMCKVCELPAHGMHFGVMTCRPCAAFFRRFVVLNLDYVCLQDKEKCNLINVRRNSCRQCRFNKCVQVGMTAENVQLNRDAHSNNTRMKNIKTQDLKSEEDTICSNKPSTSLMPVVKIQDKLYTKSILSEIQYDNLYKDMHEVFMSDTPSLTHGYFTSLTPLYRFVEGLQLIRKLQEKDEIKFENRLTMETLVPHWRAQAKRTATLTMHSMAFRTLPLTEASRIYKTVWKNIYRLERIQMSTEIFGGKCVSEKKLAISCERAIHLDSLFFDIEGMSENDCKLSLEDYKTFAERCVEEVAKPLSQLYPSIEEVAFLILMFVLHNEESIKGESLEICDQFRDSIADDLHKYYQKNEVVNYAQRIAKMMEIIIAMKKIHYEDRGGGFITNTKNSKLGITNKPTGCIY